MTPDLGQGGCQALEAAATLATLLPARLSGGEVERALAEYSRQRARRAGDMVRRSSRAGRLNQLPMWVRVLAGRATGVVPARVLARSFAPVVTWEPPQA
jgi:2-polyprenyl-6-methoxyphenol hydroxylase-like FAD-dependent oxidoreductase